MHYDLKIFSLKITFNDNNVIIICYWINNYYYLMKLNNLNEI